MGLRLTRNFACALLFGTALLLTGCEGFSSSPQTVTGQFIDDPVQG